MSRLRGLTAYQLELLGYVRAGIDGKCVDLDQLLERLSWKPTKQSLQFTIRALISKGVLMKADPEVRRGRKRVCFALTLAGRSVFDPRGPAVADSTDAREVGDPEKVSKNLDRGISDGLPDSLPGLPLGGENLEDYLPAGEDFEPPESYEG
jgi:hypothetical protein